MAEDMAFAHLGRSGLMVSRIGLGTMNFGYVVDEPSSFTVMDAAVAAESTSSTPPTYTAARSRRT
jgi:aryl-alcohol dehydrogenase-like predicted oxidoreductase